MDHNVCEYCHFTFDKGEAFYQIPSYNDTVLRVCAGCKIEHLERTLAWQAMKLRAAEDDRDMGDGVIDMIREQLSCLSCCCGGAGCEAHKATPPMMYPEWICCVVHHARTNVQAQG